MFTVYFIRLGLLLAITTCSGFKVSCPRTTRSLRQHHLHATEKAVTELTIEDIAARYKVIAFGESFGLENTDKNLVDVTVSAVTSRVGGLGLDLAEMQRGRGKSGLVLISEIAKGSNADQTGKFKVGDALLSVADSRDPSKVITLQGLNFDATIDALSSFSPDVTSVEFTLMRLMKREKITVEIYGPDGTFVESFQIPAAYGVNLRRELLARDLKMYDAATYRFDSQYQTGDCGGEGTCATCTVAITGDKVLFACCSYLIYDVIIADRRITSQGLLSEPSLVEDKIGKKQGFLPSWRLACRTIVGNRKAGNKAGTIRVTLRPQTKYS